MFDDFKDSMSWTTEKLHIQLSFIQVLDELVDSFLEFPDSIPLNFRDKQFARHLLWRIGDEHKNINLLFKRGADPLELSTFWVHLMPYITGQFPESILPYDKALVFFSEKMYVIVHDLIAFHISSFDELMEQVVELIVDTRKQYAATRH